MADHQAYQTMLDAALAGMGVCRTTMPRDMECGYGVYKTPDGQFYITDAQSGQNGSIEGMSLRIPRASSLVAFGHTHPRGEHVSDQDDTSNAFSAGDTQFAKRTGLDMYMGSEKSGQVVHYKHGASKLERNSQLGRISYGEPVGTYGEEPTRRDVIAAQMNAGSK